MNLITFWFIINYNSLECLYNFLVYAQIYTTDDQIKSLSPHVIGFTSV
jgi:hypothetical protein